MRLIIVRHGETEENVKKIVQGQGFGTLTKRGVEQAKRLGERLKKEKMDAVYCSDLKRARNTAKEIMKFHPKIPIHYVKALRERSFTVLEGKPGDVYKEAAAKEGLPRYLYRPPGGENFPDMKDRIMPFFEKVYSKYSGKRVLFVTHGGVIKVILGAVLGKTWKELQQMDVANSSVNVIEVKRNHEYKVHLLNCIRHL